MFLTPVEMIECASESPGLSTALGTVSVLNKSFMSEGSFNRMPDKSGLVFLRWDAYS